MLKSVENKSMHIKFDEDLIAPNVKEFDKNVAKYLEEETDLEEVVVDMSAIQNIDSVGITFIVGMFRDVTKDGKLFKVLGCNNDIKQLFRLMKLDDFFDIED
jgi:anti-anti-sigma factor